MILLPLVLGRLIVLIHTNQTDYHNIKAVIHT